MPNKRLSMRKLREVLRLHHEGHLSARAIGRCLALSPASVLNYLERVSQAALSWPLPEEMDDEQLERLLFPPEPKVDVRPEPDWEQVYHELKRHKHLTLRLLWQEYREAHPDGYRYSWFCEHFRLWCRSLHVVMRQPHRAGEKLFVDYTGQTVPVVDASTGEIRQAEVFVAVLGASNYTYAEATWTQGLPDWIGSHTRAFTFFGGVPELLVPDNLKSGVLKAHRYEPEANPTYTEMAVHYDVAIIPARVRKPRDKAKVENAVLVVERWILARLRNHTHFTLGELNQRIAALVEDLNNEPFQKLSGSRRSFFESLDRPALRPLPTRPYDLAIWKKVTVHIDYHVSVEGHYYSVPYQFVGQPIDIRLTELTVECFLRGKRVASHARRMKRGGYTTCTEHMPEAHRHYAEWTPQRLVDWARQSGEATAEVVATIMRTRAHPQQGFRSCLGIMRLGKTYGTDRLEAAARRALLIGSPSFKSIASILEQGLDSKPIAGSEEDRETPIHHTNIRGPRYYN